MGIKINFRTRGKTPVHRADAKYSILQSMTQLLLFEKH